MMPFRASVDVRHESLLQASMVADSERGYKETNGSTQRKLIAC